MRLGEVAHSRCGDKGNTLNIAVIAYDLTDYPSLVKWLSVERVQQHLRDFVRGNVERHLLPSLGVINFVLHDALSGGVTRSLMLDPHGKTLSSVLLDLEIAD